MIRLRIEIMGAVQGVGFRPCVHRLAGELGLAGWVRNSTAGVEIEIEGNAELARDFPHRLKRELPPHASITRTNCREIPVEGGLGFKIESSATGGADETVAEVLPDLATCPECLKEVFDPADRRYGYPFTNCTHCGPRFSIVQRLPYDRANTTMKDFEMCSCCRDEYESPSNRRFHAQPNACPDCGPQLSWLDATGKVLCSRKLALEQAALAIERGEIVAIKGIGGFHLFADARSSKVIAVLRLRKHRPEKPLALMVASLEAARELVEISDMEADWLGSSAAPIVVLKRRKTDSLPESLAPGNPGLGIMLPYSPLHHILMKRLGFPVIATSGNRGDEPICTENDHAVERLRGIADGFLVHNRPIERPVDDSVIRKAAGGRLFLRRSRGIAPAPISVPGMESPVLAYGGDLKGAIAVAGGNQVRLSQHLGDLASLESRRAFERHIEDFPALCSVKTKAVACDQHPGYLSHQLAHQVGQSALSVQHHYAHAVACAVDRGISPDEKFLAVVWDGTGYGDDGSVWGGEFLLCHETGFDRFAWLRPFPLPGSEKAVRDPRFAAFGCLFEAGISAEETNLSNCLTAEELRVVRRMIEQEVNTPRCSSMGRLFDAVSALCGLCFENSFEGQAAMALEFAASPDSSIASYSLAPALSEDGEIHWAPLLRAVVDDLGEASVDVSQISRRFHLALAGMVVEVAKKEQRSIVALTGGCFQNALLLELTISALNRAGFQPIWHTQVPPNDGGLALGQAVIASRQLSMQTFVR